MHRGRLVIGVSGGSGPVMAVHLLRALRAHTELELHLILSHAAVRTLQLEAPELSLDEVRALADCVHDFRDVAAAPASGSWRCEGMVVIPASMHTCAAIAHSLADNLLVRAADVNLKERRKVIIVPRETPLHLGHLRTLATLAEIGTIIVPPMPAFYARPKTIEDVLQQLSGKVLDLLGIEHQLGMRWSGPEPHDG